MVETFPAPMPSPAFTRGGTPQAGFAPIQATPPRYPAPPAFAQGGPQGPGLAAGTPRWLETIGGISRYVGNTALREISVNGLPDGKEGLTGADALEALKASAGKAWKDPDKQIKAAGYDTDEAFAELERESGVEGIPQGLDREEKAALLMQLGLGIMTGGPGLISAIGQAGLQTMGSWREYKRDKQRRADRAQDRKLGVLKAKLDVEAGRESSAAAGAIKLRELEAKYGINAVMAQAAEAMANNEYLTPDQIPERLAVLRRALGGDQEALAQVEKDEDGWSLSGTIDAMKQGFAAVTGGGGEPTESAPVAPAETAPAAPPRAPSIAREELPAPQREAVMTEGGYAISQHEPSVGISPEAARRQTEDHARLTEERKAAQARWDAGEREVGGFVIDRPADVPPLETGPVAPERTPPADTSRQQPADFTPERIAGMAPPELEALTPEAVSAMSPAAKQALIKRIEALGG